MSFLRSRPLRLLPSFLPARRVDLGMRTLWTSLAGPGRRGNFSTMAQLYIRLGELLARTFPVEVSTFEKLHGSLLRSTALTRIVGCFPLFSWTTPSSTTSSSSCEQAF